MLTEAMGWTLIIGFFTILIASQALLLRVVKVENRAMGERLEKVNAQIRAEISELRGEVLTAIARIEVRLKHLEER